MSNHTHTNDLPLRNPCWSLLNRETPVYRDVLPLPHAILPKNDPLSVSFVAEREAPLQITRFEDGRQTSYHRVRVIEWLYHLSGALAPAQLTELQAVVSHDDDLMPALGGVHFKALGASLWDSATFPRHFDDHASEWYLAVNIELDSGLVVTPDVQLLRVGPEIITGPLEGLSFVDEATAQVEESWRSFCHDARHWFVDCGITRLAMQGTTATVRRK